jgi:hypothetical protein
MAAGPTAVAARAIPATIGRRSVFMGRSMSASFPTVNGGGRGAVAE